MDIPTQEHDDRAPPAPPRLPGNHEFQGQQSYVFAPMQGYSVGLMQILERDWVIIGDEVCSSDGYLPPWPPMFSGAISEAIYESYSLIRVSFVEYDVTLDTLDERIRRIAEVASITQLNDGSWEMLVLKAYIHMLPRKLCDIHQSFTLDLEHSPFEPTPMDVEYWGLDAARDLYAAWLTERARKIIKNSWYVAAVYYTYLMGHKIRAMQTRLSGMGDVEKIGVGFEWRKRKDGDEQSVLLRSSLSELK